MSKLIKICLLASVLALVIVPAISVKAQETEPVDSPEIEIEEDVPEEVTIDETVTAEDLGIKEPTLLPDSNFYFLKNWRRGIRSIFTRDPAKKAELKLKYASEKLLEARKLAEKKKRPEILIKATESFGQEMARVRVQIDKMKGVASTSPKIGKFLDKFVQKEFLHQKILDKIEEQVPEGALERIRTVKEAQLVRFGEVMDKLEDKAQIKTRIENNLEQLEGSVFKQVKEMEILKRFEEKAPEAVKEKIMEAREGRLEDFKDKLVEMKPDVQEKFQNYVGEMKGLAENKMEIIEDVKQRIQGASPVIKERLESAKEQIMNSARVQIERKGINCPLNMINPRSCNGKVVIERDENDCPIPRCIEVTEVPTAVVPSVDVRPGSGQPEEPVSQCVALFSPVCGVNGKTYGNVCYAKMAGVEIRHKGACAQRIDINTGKIPIERTGITDSSGTSNTAPSTGTGGTTGAVTTDTVTLQTLSDCATQAECEYVKMSGSCNNPARAAAYWKKIRERGILPALPPPRDGVVCKCVNNKCIEITVEEPADTAPTPSNQQNKAGQ